MLHTKSYMGLFCDFLDPVVTRPSLYCFLVSTSIESLDASSAELTNYDIANICLFAEVEKYFLSKLDGEILKEHIIDHPYLCENILTSFIQPTNTDFMSQYESL